MVDFKMRVREGNRGGRELFKWDQVKEDAFKDREQYLGYTTRVGLMGKFGRYIVHDWYIHDRQKADGTIDKEIADVQAFEEELMQEALGLKPKNLILRKKEWNEEEFEKFKQYDAAKKKAGEDGGTRDGIGKVGGGRDELNDKIQAEFTSTEETKGLGFAAHRTAKLEAFKAETFGVKGELAGANLHMKTKEELEQDIRMKYCGSASSSGSSDRIKSEPVIKRELKDHPDEAEEPSSSAGNVVMKEEIKREKDEDQEEVKVKSEKKDKKEKKGKKDKKDKKAKKMKKKAKELKKVAKEIAKLKKKRKRNADGGDSSDSSSSS